MNCPVCVRPVATGRAVGVVRAYIYTNIYECACAHNLFGGFILGVMLKNPPKRQIKVPTKFSTYTVHNFCRIADYIEGPT